MKRLVGFVAMLEMENAVTLLILGAESTNLIQNHPLGSYKHGRITEERSRRVQTPNGPSGQILSTQRKEFPAGLGEYIERIM